MIINKNTTIDEIEIDDFTWSDVPADDESITTVFSGKEIVGVEAQSYPLVDALNFALFDSENEQMQFVLVEIDEALLVGDLAACEGSPLIVRVSESVTVEPTPA